MIFKYLNKLFKLDTKVINNPIKCYKNNTLYFSYKECYCVSGAECINYSNSY